MTEKELTAKLSTAKMGLLNGYPFFGRLLYNLRLCWADCQTAYTDMRNIAFDPEFARRISPKEVEFVMLHEVLHCALKHCTRASGKERLIYNIACDIVVNSIILDIYGEDEFAVDGENAMHLAPNGVEGREYTAEQVYSMLMKMSPKDVLQKYGDGNTDCHDDWDKLDSFTLEDLWSYQLRKAAAESGCANNMPGYMARYIKELSLSPRANWRQILHDFIQFDQSDYSFNRPDSRYQDDIIMPSFCNNEHGSKVDNLWFFVDTSGSISDEALALAYNEIKQATTQIDNLSGMLSFFDHTAYDPTPFESLEEILAMKPQGGGGTSFYSIFRKVADHCKNNDLPKVIVIITDGDATFPPEDMAMDVPVIWIIVNSNITPPWGACAFISS